MLEKEEKINKVFNMDYLLSEDEKSIQLERDYKCISFNEGKLRLNNFNFEDIETFEFYFDLISICKIKTSDENLYKTSLSIHNILSSVDQDKINIKHIKELEFVNCFFNNLFIDKLSSINKITLKNSIVSKKMIIKREKLDYINFSDSTFKGKVEIKECLIENFSYFNNTKFEALCDFYATKFNDNSFEKTIFNDITVFTESVFYKKVDFKYTIFSKLVLFRKTIFKDTLDLEKSIIKEEANFLDITSKKDKQINIKVKNRETARIIKNSFEKENNIIEANKFYALEMKEREKELSKDKMWKNIKEWLVFRAHFVASNHSQDYILPVLWILNFALFMSMSMSTFNHNNMLACISIFVMLLSFLIINKVILLQIILSINFIIFYFLSYIHLDSVADKINPFSIMTSKDPITFGLLLFKITIAYLIYQFIVSVRQNTRRK